MAGSGQGGIERSSASPRTLRLGPLIVGASLLVTYVRVGAYLGFGAEYGALGYRGEPWERALPFVHVSSGESRMWIAHLVLGLPSVVLLAWGLMPWLVRGVGAVDAAIGSASVRQRRLGWALMLVCGIGWAALGNRAVLLGEPITDDENAVMFGARMVANGHLSVPELTPPNTFNQIFTFERDGMVSSMDYPGAIIFAAASVATGLGALWYALAAALSGVAVAYAAGRWFGRRASVLAAAIWMASPMIGALSMTTHAHVASRCFVAVAIALAARLDTEAGTPRRDALGFGAACGLAFLCRPFEATCVLAPIALWLAVRVLRDHRGPRVMLLLALAGFAPALVVFAWWNAKVTGVWYLPARFADGAFGVTQPLAGHGPWERLASNLGFNAMMLGVYFLGIPAVGAVIVALRGTATLPRVLGASVALHLLLCLAHDDTGIHSVGPIHLSESVVPLTLLVTAGVISLVRWAARLGARDRALVGVASYLVVWCGLLQVPNLASLHDHARANHTPFEVLTASEVHHAIVIAPPPMVLFRNNSHYTQAGSWVHHFPHPDPWFRDDVIFAEGPGPEGRGPDPIELHARFPDREIWRLGYTRDIAPFTLERLVLPAEPKPAAVP